MQSELSQLRAGPAPADTAAVSEAVNAQTAYRMHLYRVAESLSALVASAAPAEALDVQAKSLLSCVKSIAEHAATLAATDVAGGLPPLPPPLCGAPSHCALVCGRAGRGCGCAGGVGLFVRPSTAPASEVALRAEVMRLTRDLREAKADLARDEEIFTRKAEAITQLQSAIESEYRDNELLRAQVAALSQQVDQLSAPEQDRSAASASLSALQEGACADDSSDAAPRSVGPDPGDSKFETADDIDFIADLASMEAERNRLAVENAELARKKVGGPVPPGVLITLARGPPWIVPRRLRWRPLRLQRRRSPTRPSSGSKEACAILQSV